MKVFIILFLATTLASCTNKVDKALNLYIQCDRTPKNSSGYKKAKEDFTIFSSSLTVDDLGTLDRRIKEYKGECRKTQRENDVKQRMISSMLDY